VRKTTTASLRPYNKKLFKIIDVRQFRGQAFSPTRNALAELALKSVSLGEGTFTRLSFGQNVRRDRMKKPVHRAYRLEDALLALHEMEASASQLENSDAFQAFTATQKAQYRDALSRLRDLIHDLEQDSAQEQLAS
jgi:hypothetical protein